MSFVKYPVEILTAPNLNNGEKIMIAALINFSLDEEKSFIGNYKLAEFLNTSRPAVIRTLKELEKKQYIEINQRKNSSKSNEILLTFSRGLQIAIAGSQKTQKEYQIDTPMGYQNDTPKGYQNDTVGYQNDTPHIDLKFKNPDLNLKNGVGYQNDTPNDAANKEELATADRAAVRSMPDYEPAKGSLGGDFEAKDQEIAGFFNLHYPTFRSWYSLIRTTSGNYRVHPVTDFIARIIPEPEQIKTLPVGVMLANTALPPSADFVKIL